MNESSVEAVDKLTPIVYPDGLKDPMEYKWSSPSKSFVHPITFEGISKYCFEILAEGFWSSLQRSCILMGCAIVE